MTAAHEEWLDQHIDHAEAVDYQGAALTRTDYVHFLLAGAAFPLVVSVIGWLVY